MAAIKRPTTAEQRAVLDEIPLNDFLDDYEDQYETFDSVKKATQENGYVDVQQVMEEHPLLFDMKQDAQQLAEDHKEFVENVQYQEVKKQWEHVENQPEDVQKAIVDNINIKLVFEVMMNKHAKLDDTEYKLQEMRNPSMEEQHRKAYESLLADMTASMKVINDKKTLIDALG